MKNMKGLVAKESPLYAVYEDPRTMYRYQSLLQDYEELQKETGAMKGKLLTMKQKRLVLSAEVRFLRRRYKQLKANQALQPKPKQDMLLQRQTFDMRPPAIRKSRHHYRKELAQRPPAVAADINLKQRTYYGVETKLPKACQVFDLNQNDASVHSPVSALDLNQDIMYSGKEAANKRSITPFFDLNQISGECQAGFIGSLGMDEPRRSMQRGASEEQHNDMKMSVCRSSGNGASRPGKRKISWQDQVALKV